MTPFLQLQSHSIPYYTSFPSGSVGKEFACQCRRLRRLGFNPRDQEDPLEKEMATHSREREHFWEKLRRNKWTWVRIRYEARGSHLKNASWVSIMISWENLKVMLLEEGTTRTEPWLWDACAVPAALSKPALDVSGSGAWRLKAV